MELEGNITTENDILTIRMDGSGRKNRYCVVVRQMSDMKHTSML